MGKIQMTKSGGWGERIKIENGIAELEVSTSFGPHIMHFGFCGKQNFLFENPAMDIGNQDPEMKAFGEDAKWYIYGGHRLWHSPEAMPRTYYPDNDPVRYEETQTGVRFLPEPQKYTRMQNEIEIQMMADQAKAIIVHKVTNLNPWPVEMAPWGITLMAHGGMEVIPLPQEDTGLLNNGVLGLWPYTKLNDKRVFFGEKYITLEHDPKAKGKFKIGLSNKEGFAAYFHHNGLFVKSFSYEKDAVYPDDGMSFETYTDPGILECESIGKYWKLAQGETAVHVETWQLFDGIEKPGKTDEKAIEAALKPFYSQR